MTMRKQLRGALSFREKEKACALLFDDVRESGIQFWHVCTPGGNQEIILRDSETQVFAMNVVWMAWNDCPGLRVYTFEWMSNHFHALVSGPRELASEFIRRIRKRLRRFFIEKKMGVLLKDFFCDSPIAVESLEAFRCVAVYINRNNYVVDPSQTPFSYPWGANGYFFNPIVKRYIQGKFGDLSLRKKRRMLHCHDVDFPKNAVITDGYVSPISYCDISFTEDIFRDAWHYFSKLAKPVESYGEFAGIIGDGILYTDEELFGIITRMCRSDYGVEMMIQLDKNQRIDCAKKLRFGYNAGNGQICRLLKLERSIVDALFPMSVDRRNL